VPRIRAAKYRGTLKMRKAQQSRKIFHAGKNPYNLKAFCNSTICINATRMSCVNIML